MFRNIGTLVIILSFVMSGCGSAADTESGEYSSQCTVPPGTYTQTWSSAGGNCPTEFVNEMTSVRQDYEIESGTECGTVTTEESGTTESGCEYVWTATVERTSSGLNNSQATVEITCPGGSSCTHDFNLYHERR